MAKTDKKSNSGKKHKKRDKLAKAEKETLRLAEDRKAFHRSDRKTLAEVSGKGDAVAAVSPRVVTTSASVQDERGPSSNVSTQASGATGILGLSGTTGIDGGSASSQSSKGKSPIHYDLARHAATNLAIAAGLGFLIGLVFLRMEGGYEAVPAMGGVLEAAVPIDLARLVLALDMLFPIFFGAGLALLSTSCQSRGNRPLVRLILTVLLVAVLADFVENALVFKMMTGGGVQPIQWVATVIKYAGLALSAVMLSAILPVIGFFGWLTHLLLRFVFPFGVAVLVAGIGGNLVRDAAGGSFPVILLIIAIYTALLADGSQGDQ